MVAAPPSQLSQWALRLSPEAARSQTRAKRVLSPSSSSPSCLPAVGDFFPASGEITFGSCVAVSHCTQNERPAGW